MRRKPLEYLFVTLKGMAMGAADVVPGVSGGTIAFISGIYEELVSTIDNIKLSSLKVWKKEGFKAMWNSLNGNFLLALLTGIAISIMSLAKLITYLLETYPIVVWSFFFGLVIASIYFVGKQVSQWNIRAIIAIAIGIAVSYYITIAHPVSSPDSYAYLFFSGFIAIIAMILPGISGAFILLLMGSYGIVMSTVNQFREGIFQFDFQLISQAFSKLAVFAIGAIIGIKSFSGVLNWMFKHHKNTTLALLTGFMVGSLNKIWPWKEVLSWRTNSHNEQVPLLEKSILPIHFDGDAQVFTAVISAVFGFLTIYLLERIAIRAQKSNE
ncbi:polyprenyl-phosphate transporter [Sinomicrobium sp.]